MVAMWYSCLKGSEQSHRNVIKFALDQLYFEWTDHLHVNKIKVLNYANYGLKYSAMI